MSKFRRSGHVRTNSRGTKFWVSEHNVSRFDWAHIPAGGQIEVGYSYRGTSYGITYPNALCPECQAPVFFFAAHNGGRVFFDPPLGPPWPKHPCTISETMSVFKEGNAEAPPLKVEQVETLGYEVYPQVHGSVFVVEIEGVEKAFSTPYDFNRPHLDRAWPHRNKRGSVTGLSLLTLEFEPVEVPVRARRLPRPMSSSIRKTLAGNAMRNIPSLSERMEQASAYVLEKRLSQSDLYEILMRDGDAVVFIPVPVDHKWTFTENEIFHIRSYMYATAGNAIARLAERRSSRPKLAQKHKVVFCFDDFLGTLRRSSAWEFGLGSDGKIDYDVWHLPGPSLKSLDARVVWIDSVSTEKFSLPDGRITVEEALELEANFCNAIWPGGEEGRWRKLQKMVSELGMQDRFQGAVRALRSRGWLLVPNDEWASFTHELVFARKTEAASTLDRLCISLWLSTSDELAVIAGWDADSSPVESYLNYVNEPQDLMPILDRLEAIHKS